MKKSLLVLCLLVVFGHSHAQKGFWGLISLGGSATTNHGNMYVTDSAGGNAAIVHSFEPASGIKPYGKLFQASNGKLYGTASEGGYTLPGTTITGGVLFEYDLVLDSFRVVTYFGDSLLPNLRNPKMGLSEPIPGILVGTASGIGTFKYDIASESTTFGSLVFVSYAGSGAFANSITGELMKATDGNMYGTTQYYSSCPTTTPFMGCIIRFNPTTNAFTYRYPFNCTYFDGANPTGSLVEATSGKLYGTTSRGGAYGYNTGGQGDGTLFEYNITANTFTRKIDFNQDSAGSFPGPLTLGANNKLYGLLGGFGNDPSDPDPNNVVKGSLYEYDLANNKVTVLKYFSDLAPNIFPYNTPRGSLLKASDGNLFGIDQSGIFKYDPLLNELSRPTPPGVPYFYVNFSEDLIEVCRKPSYQYFNTDSFTVCAGDTFSFDVHNSNATSYTWKKDGVAVLGQTNGILSMLGVALADSGTYTCEMQNSCGTTVTMPLQLQVNNCQQVGLAEALPLKGAVSLYPNPTTDMLHLKLAPNSGFKLRKCTITNTLGQTVYTEMRDPQKIDVSGFGSGLYLVEVATDKGSWFGKFIKE